MALNSGYEPINPGTDLEDMGDDKAYRNAELAKCLTAYNTESRQGRLNRDIVWRKNKDVYWQRYDFSKKLPHQFKLVMPEGPLFVERFAAAMKEALLRSQDFFTVEIPDSLKSREPWSKGFDQFVKKVILYWLDRCGDWIPDASRGFPAVFEDIAKNGAMAMMAATVTWEEVEKEVVTYEGIPSVIPSGDGYRLGPPRGLGRVRKKVGMVAVKPVDPTLVWYDPTGRGLYRRIRRTVDYWQLLEMAEARDEEGNFIWDRAEIERLRGSNDPQQEQDRMRITNETAIPTASVRRETILDEYLGTIIDYDGKAIAKNALTIMANESVIIRGPEINPYLHGRDWLVATPLIRVPGFPYGKSYMETWTDIIGTFTEFTNALLDIAYRSGIKAHAGDIAQCENPDDLMNGLVSGLFIPLVEGADPQRFVQEIELGNFSPELIGLWSLLKNEAQEGAVLNDLLMGQVIPGRRTAQEVSQTWEASAAFIRAIAQTVENNFLTPLIELIWFVALQHMDFMDNADLRSSMPEDLQWVFELPDDQRQEMFSGSLSIKVKGISAVLERELTRQAMMAATGIIFQSRDITQMAMQQFDVLNFITEVFRQFNVDSSKFFIPPSDQQLQTQARMDAVNNPQPTTPIAGGPSGQPGVPA
jgi:hypothetical protein